MARKRGNGRGLVRCTASERRQVIRFREQVREAARARRMRRWWRRAAAAGAVVALAVIYTVATAYGWVALWTVLVMAPIVALVLWGWRRVERRGV